MNGHTTYILCMIQSSRTIGDILVKIYHCIQVRGWYWEEFNAKLIVT